jgi:ribose 5-phosphate isomerase B
MKIYIGADHNGFQMHNELIRYLVAAGYEVEDVGNTKLESDDDFPTYASQVAHKILETNDQDARGILLCGSGQGMCIAVNRFKGIRACLGYDQASAKAGRNDSNCNVLCLPANSLDQNTANLIVETWLNAPFEGAERFNRRIEAIDKLG